MTSRGRSSETVWDPASIRIRGYDEPFTEFDVIVNKKDYDQLARYALIVYSWPFIKGKSATRLYYFTNKKDQDKMVQFWDKRKGYDYSSLTLRSPRLIVPSKNFTLRSPRFEVPSTNFI